jgi:hypothetical protein
MQGGGFRPRLERRPSKSDATQEFRLVLLGARATVPLMSSNSLPPSSAYQTRRMNTSARRWLVAGVVAAAIPYFLLGFAFLRTGFLYLIAPDALADEGFRQDAPLGTRVAALVFFGGVGAALAWSSWRLVRLKRRGLNVVRGLALALGLLFASRIFRGTDQPYLDWSGLASSIAVAGYLSVSAVRALFRGPARASSPRADTP